MFASATGREERVYMVFESKLLPILRQGIAVVQMVLFKRLRERFGIRYPEGDPTYIRRLSGAVVNEIFGSENDQEPFASFVKENEAAITEEVKRLPLEMVDMMVPLTDALRIQVLCDAQEGIDSSTLLMLANERKILLLPREIPLPAKFIDMVRRLGHENDILLPMEIVGMHGQN